MRRDDLEWAVKYPQEDESSRKYERKVQIMGMDYMVDENTACLANAILLLIDSINDKDFK